MVQKCPLFVNIHTIENVNAGEGVGVGGQKKPNSCQRSLWTIPNENKHERDFVLQVRCRDLNNSCDKISTLRGTKAVTNISWDKIATKKIWQSLCNLQDLVYFETSDITKIWEEFFGKIFFWGGGHFLGGFFWEDFFGRIFLGGILWEELLSRN